MSAPLWSLSAQLSTLSCSAFSAASEIKPINIVLHEEERLPEEDIVTRDLERAQGAGLETLGPGLQLALRHRRRRVNREIAKVLGVPQHDRIGHALVYVTLVLVRQAEADDMHLARLAGLLDRLSGAGRAGRADGDQCFQIRVGAHERRCLGLGPVLEIVARAHG